MTSLAVIGGTGMDGIQGFRAIEQKTLETPFGSPSSAITLGELDGAACAFLARHGNPRHLPPHLVNYRANIWALRELGITRILSVNTVGGINPLFKVGDLVINDQIIDYTYGREHSYFNEKEGEFIDFTQPFDADMRSVLLAAGEAAAGDLGFACHAAGCCAVTQGPRLETAAEVRRLARDGADVVGMTLMPEASLAAELKLAYASISPVVNPAAGLSEPSIDISALMDAAEKITRHTGALLQLAVPKLA